jgi:hypothetical protein
MIHRASWRPPNTPLEQTAGSHSLAAAAHRARWADKVAMMIAQTVGFRTRGTL